MKTIIKLILMVVVLNAVARAGMAAWSYYQLKDAAQQIVTFGARTPTPDLHSQIVERARELEVPLVSENLSVERQGARTRADAAYVQPVELFPNYIYPVNLSFRVEAFSAQ